MSMSNAQAPAGPTPVQRAKMPSRLAATERPKRLAHLDVTAIRACGAGPSDSDEPCKGVDPSGGGGEECEGVGPSDPDWRRSFDMAATFLTTTGTTPSSCASYISRTTGVANTRLKMESIRRI
jgi:hypothetical protein